MEQLGIFIPIVEHTEWDGAGAVVEPGPSQWQTGLENWPAQPLLPPHVFYF